MFEESVTSVPSLWATVNSWFTPTVLFILLNLMIGTIAITSNLGSNKNNDRQQQQRQQAPEGSPPRTLARSPSMLQRLKSMNFHVYRSQEPTTMSDERPPQQDMQVHSFQQEEGQAKEQPFFTRSPTMLQRLKSIKLYGYMSPQEHKETDSHFSFQKANEEEEEEEAKLHLYSEDVEDEGIQVTNEEEEPKLHLNEGEEKNEEAQKEEMTLDEVYSQLKSDAPPVDRTMSDTKPASGEVPAKLATKMRKSASVKSAFSHFEEDDIIETRRPATVREEKANASAVEADEEVDAKADDFINKFKQQLKLQRIDSIAKYNEMIRRGSAR